MPELPANFPCPWCGMSYPAKPVLVGKPVRCKGCRNAFVLQPEGHATKVEDPPPAPAPPKPAPPAPAPPKPAPVVPKPEPPVPPSVHIDPITPVPPKPAVRAKSEVILDAPPSVPPAVAASSPVNTPAPAKVGTERQGRSARLTAQLLESRKQLSAQLAQVAAQAEQSEVVQKAEKASERIAKPGGTAKPSTDRTRKREAILTGEGLAEHRNRMQWLIGLAVAVAVGLGIYLVMTFDSAPRVALESYGMLPGTADTAYPRLGRVIRNRAWLIASPLQPGGPELATDLSDAQLGDERSLDLGAQRERLVALKGLRLHESGWWVAPAKVPDLLKIIEGRKPADVLTLAKARKLDVVHHAALVQDLTTAGLTADDVAVVMALLTGTPSPDGVDAAARMLDDGDVPNRLRLLPFHGANGEFKADAGHPPYRTVRKPYQGILARFEGAGWPGTWRVLRLEMQP